MAVGFGLDVEVISIMKVLFLLVLVLGFLDVKVEFVLSSCLQVLDGYSEVGLYADALDSHEDVHAVFFAEVRDLLVCDRLA